MNSGNPGARPRAEQDDLRKLLTRTPLHERSGVMDFVSDPDDYCRNFGMQWQRFRDVQIDSITSTPDSGCRFWAETGWTPTKLADMTILDAGCGAGRFAAVALGAGARVVAMDLSEAAYACAQTLESFPHDRFLVLRADIFNPPLQTGSFDGIYSLGVLQHTPEPLGAVGTLVPLLKPGGNLAVWIYEKRFWRWFQVRTLIRWATRGCTLGFKEKLAFGLTLLFFPLGWSLSWLGRFGEKASHLLPYAARHHLGRGDFGRQWKYSLLDTIDWYGPAYDLPQSQVDVESAMRVAGLVEIRRTPARGMAIVGRMPDTASMR
jgi:SAM-dependent methyltransferase